MKILLKYVLTLKELLLVLKDDVVNNKCLHFDIDGEKKFYAKDIAVEENIIIGNPEHLIFSSNSVAKFTFEIQIARGRGYIPSEKIQTFIKTIGIIPLDADFSPVKRVSYKIDIIRYDDSNNYEKLQLEVESKGIRIPEELIKESSLILREYFLTFDNLEESDISSFTDAVSVDIEENIPLTSMDDFDQSIYNMDFAIKTLYFLRKNGLHRKSDVTSKTEERTKTNGRC